MEKIMFDITGMTCSACQGRIEKGISKMDGIEEVRVNLLTNSMSVVFDAEKADTGQIIKKVEHIGYGASLKTTGAKKQTGQPVSDVPSETLAMKNRLIVSFAFGVLLFYCSMGEMLGWPLPGFLSGMEHAMIYAFTLFLLTLPILYVGRGYFRTGFRNLFRLSPNMDSLIAIGSGAAVLYGVFSILGERRNKL